MEEKRLTHEEITKEALEMFAKETANFGGVLGIPKDKPKKERPFVTKQMIDKAKKKLKKLQKRQRKQDKQGVVSVDDVINAPVITECLAVFERPIVCDDGLKHRIIDTKALDEFIKFRDKMARPS